jgi:co-chaperonin GroES (HSP10)
VSMTENQFGWIKPRRGRIIVLLDQFEYKGRLVIPDRAQAPPTTGVIVRIGEGTDGVEDLKIGDKIVFGVYSGTLLKFKNKPKLRVLIPDEILAVVGETDVELEATEA